MPWARTPEGTSMQCRPTHKTWKCTKWRNQNILHWRVRWSYKLDDYDSTSKVSRGTLFLSYQSLLKKRSNHFSPFASLSTFALLYFIVCVCIFQFLYLSISMFVYAFFNVCICVFQCRAECSGDKVGSPGASSCPPLSLLIVWCRSSRSFDHQQITNRPPSITSSSAASITPKNMNA